MVRTVKSLVLFLVLLLATAANAQSDHWLMNTWNGNVSNSGTVSASTFAPIYHGDSLIATFAARSGGGTFADTITDSVGNTYKLLKNPTGTALPNGGTGVTVANYICLYPISDLTTAATISSPISGTAYSYWIEWYLGDGSGVGRPGLLTPGQVVVTDKIVWSNLTSTAFTPLLLPNYNAVIPDYTLGVGFFMTADGSDFDHSFHSALSPLAFGGWDWDWTAVWGSGWTMPHPVNCYPGSPTSCSGDPANEYYESDSGGVSVLVSYAVFHLEAASPTGGNQPVVQVQIGQ